MSRLSKKLPVIAAMFLAMVGGPSSMAMTQEAPLPVTQEQSILADLPEGITARFDDTFVYFQDGSKMSLEHCRNTGTP